MLLEFDTPVFYDLVLATLAAESRGVPGRSPERDSLQSSVDAKLVVSRLSTVTESSL